MFVVASVAMAGSKDSSPKDSALVNGDGEERGGEGGETAENLWSSLLGEVQTSRSSQLPSSKALLVLGDKESGKTTLIAKLQGNEDPKKGSGLEYGYIDVRDEYRDDHTRLSHWILDGDTSHANLLNFALTERNYEGNTMEVRQKGQALLSLHHCRHHGGDQRLHDDAVVHHGPAPELGELVTRSH